MLPIGAFLIFLNGIADCADGDIARATDTVSKFGRHLDGVADFLLAGLIPISIGLGLYWKTDVWLYPFLGGLCAFTRLFSNVLTLTHDANASGKIQDVADGSWLAKWGIRAALLEVPVLIVCSAVNLLEVHLSLFTLLFVGKAVGVIFVTTRKEGGDAQRN